MTGDHRKIGPHHPAFHPARPPFGSEPEAQPQGRRPARRASGPGGRRPALLAGHVVFCAVLLVSGCGATITGISRQDNIETIKHYLQDERGWVREHAALRLGELGRLNAYKADKAIPLLLKSLKDDKPWVRARSAEALGRIRANSAAAHLIQALQDEEITVQCQALNALARIGDPKALDAVQAMRSSRHLLVRGAAEAAYEELRSK